MKARYALLLAFVGPLAACARPSGHATRGPAPTDTLLAATPAPGNSLGTVRSDSTAPRDSVDVTATEVARQAVEVFGDSMAPAAALLDSAGPDSSADAEMPTWDIDVRSYETHERVEHFVRLFGGEARDRMAKRLERGSRYEPMIRAKFRAGGLPEDMSYLALIESGYNPNAYSRAAAVGLWQFMTSTARGMGLRVDWWVDERRDPVRSTDAAIRFIRGLNDQFGSLYLAAAAYNGGPGRVARGLTRFADDLEGSVGDDRFFALAQEEYLPRETKDYVPQLIAAALVAKDPVRYGLEVRPQPPLAYDSVTVGPSTPLAAIAKASGATVSDLRDLNPHILRGVTPPGASQQVRVPVGGATGFDSAYAALAPAERAAYRRVVSRKGETMASLAARYQLSARQLGWYNPKASRLKSGRLRPGQTMLVPTLAVALAAVDVPDPAVERYGSSGRTKTHVVRRGESLGTIARKYKTSVATLKRLNGLRKSIIFPGQSIVVKGSPAKARRGKTARASTARRKPSVAAPRPPATGTAKKSKGAAVRKTAAPPKR